MFDYFVENLGAWDDLLDYQKIKRLIVDHNQLIAEEKKIDEQIFGFKAYSERVETKKDQQEILLSKLDAVIEKWEEIDEDLISVDLAHEHNEELHHDHENEPHALFLPEDIQFANTPLPSDNDFPGFSSYDTSQAFLLNSNLGSNFTIYLDFDGHTTSDTLWTNNVTSAFDLDGNSSTFNETEKEIIIETWQRVSEDFIPFDVNVTTQTPTVDQLKKSGSTDTQWGIRVVIGGNGSWYSSNIYGGVSYIGSFDWDSDTPAYVFADNLYGKAKNIGEAISHEVGHSLGLSHDSTSSQAYYRGANGWAPIMGFGYSQPVTQWSKGEYADANNNQDDLAIITSNNGFGYRLDDHGGAVGSATALTNIDGNVSGFGIIEKNTDFDYFSFNTGDGTVNLTINPAEIDANLDILAQIFDSNGKSIAISDDSSTLSANFSLALTKGQYFLSITGTGNGTFYSDYGSLGQYSISGNVIVFNNDSPPPNTAPTIISSTSVSVLENQTNAIDVNSTDDQNSEGNGLTYGIIGGVDAILFSIDPLTGLIKFKNAPDFENPLDAGKNNIYDIQVNVTDSVSLSAVQNISITVNNIELEGDPPNIYSSANTTVIENQTLVIDVNSNDPQGDTEGNGLIYSLTGGVDVSFFSINPNNGVVTFKNAPDFENPLDAGKNNIYDLQVTVTDSDNRKSSQNMTINVVNVNESPTIISPATISVEENQTIGIDVNSTDIDGQTENVGGLTYSITGGADLSLFSIDLNQGIITFKNAPDFEKPLDAGEDNVYELQVTVTDKGGLTDKQDIRINVLDQLDASTNIPPNGDIDGNSLVNEYDSLLWFAYDSFGGSQSPFTSLLLNELLGELKILNNHGYTRNTGELIFDYIETNSYAWDIDDNSVVNEYDSLLWFAYDSFGGNQSPFTSLLLNDLLNDLNLNSVNSNNVIANIQALI
jgi:hypothetical protein